MITWLHNFHPQAILFSFGPFQIYWYGLFMVSGILAALLISFKLTKFYKIDKDKLFDLSFWLIIFGLLGARLYDVFLTLPYYLHNPIAILKIWQGGLAIHGAIIAGIITVYFFARHHQLSLWSLVAIIVPGLSLAQAIGRWGNYFNQELFGLPTNLAWGIPIDLPNRPWLYISSNYFQPTFLYESIGCFIIFIVLSAITVYLFKKGKINNYYSVWIVALYMILYSVLRFTLEFIRIDETPYIFNLRWPQIISLLIIIISVIFIIFNPHAKNKKERI